MVFSLFEVHCEGYLLSNFSLSVNMKLFVYIHHLYLLAVINIVKRKADLLEIWKSQISYQHFYNNY